MDTIDLSNLAEDKDTLLKIVGLSYFGLALYLGLKAKPVRKREPAPQPRPKTEARSLSDMIRMMMEEAYGTEKTG
jgi:hypothetical protein